MKRATLFLVLLLAIAAGLWWKRDDALRLANEHAPFARPYLQALAPGQPGAAPAAPARPAPAAVPVVVATAAKKPLPLVIEAVGTVQAIAAVPIKPRLDSQVDTVVVSEGARVKQGDLLFTLDSRSLRAQLAQADAQVDKDRAQIEQNRRDLARAEDLLAKRIGTEVQRDTAQTALKVLQAQMAADQAQRANLASLVSYTEIKAPVSGRIGTINTKAGTTVRIADAQAMATVNQVDPIYVAFAVPQTLFPELRKALTGGEVRVDVALGRTTKAGKIAFIENAVDLATGTVLAKALLPNEDETLWPGTFVTVRVVLGTQQDAIAVPSAAIQLGQQGAYVFVVRDNRKADLVNVTVARTVGNESVIGSGLAGGEQVVVDGQLRLVGGAVVQVQSKAAEDTGGTRAEGGTVRPRG